MDIDVWLKELGLEAYGPAFAENDIDAGMLVRLTAEDLKEIGVTSVGHRRKLLDAIADLDGATAPSDTARADPPRAVPDDTPSAGEQRQVTVLFADLAGFTRLSEELGAEETHALLNRYFEAVDGIVAGYGGHVDKHMGDNVMAVFGAPVAHSDDPERAVRAALDVHRAMSALSNDFGRPLSAHIGIASGQVVASGTGSDTHREYTVTGKAVNLASRLQDKAEAGETLISHSVREAVAACTDCATVGEIEVKGLATPVRAWRLFGLIGDSDERRGSPFVGRRSEKRLFSTMVEDCLETDSGQALLVRGEAGIGKTRLVEECAAIAAGRGLAVHKGLVLDFGVGKGQDAVRSLVRSFLGLAPGSGKAERTDAMERAIESEWLVADDRVFVSDLLDLPQATDLRSLYDAMDNQTRNAGKQNAVSKLMRALSNRQALLITIEDIHWAKPLTLEYLARLASAVGDCPAILVMTSRLEGDPLDQAWRGTLRGSPLTTIDLQPLRPAEAEELANEFTGTAGEFLRQCIARAEGNPLFLEQLLRNAKEGALSDVPGSIQSLVLARMDRLDPRDKRALQAASVVGQRFTLELLRELIEDPEYRCDDLMAHRLIRPEAGGFLFAHALILEGVYSSLLQAQRRALHRRAADWFAERDLALRAEHLDRGEDPEAPGAYREAARAQIKVYHDERAMELVERGLAIAQSDADKVELTCLKGLILHDLGAIAESIETYRSALALAPDAGGRAHALYGLAAAMRVTDEFDQALEALGQAQVDATKDGLTLMLSRIHHLRGNLYFPIGNMDGCFEEHSQALDYARQAGSPEGEARALGGLADAMYAQGRMRSAHDRFQACIDLCRAHGFGRIEVANLSMLGLTRCYLGDLEGTSKISLAAWEAAARVGHHRAEMVACLTVPYVAWESGNSELIDKALARATEIVRQLGAKRFVPDCLNFQARSHIVRGDRAAASELMRKAIAISRETGITYCGPRVLGQLALATDDPAERESAIHEGLAILQSGAVAHNHFWFYRDVMESMLEAGRWDDAENHAQALEDFTQAERLPWTDFYIARARALARFGRGARDAALAGELRRLHDEAEHIGLKSAQPSIDGAITALSADQSSR
jgi:class 3 adenylate cyclase/tetratricopeptide (TPR) repeat protein